MDRAAIPYMENPHLPLLHMPAVMLAVGGRKGAGDRASTGYSTPVFQVEGGPLLRDSKEIVRYASEHSDEDLYSFDGMEAIETRLHDRLGPHARRVTYHNLLQSRVLLKKLARRNVGPIEASIFIATIPLVQVAMRRFLNINTKTAARSMKIVREEFAWIGDMLGDKPYLLGNRFSAADLTFASLAAASIIPGAGEGYGANLFGRDELPEEPRAIAEEMRATKAGQHALKMFREERGTRLIQCQPPLDPAQIF